MHWVSFSLIAYGGLLASSAAIPSVEADILSTLSDGLTDLVDSIVASLIPLEDFGHFNTHTLEEIKADPSLLESGSAAAAPAESLNEVERVKLATPVTNSSATTCSSPQTRIEWRKYSSSDRHAFVDGISCLMGLPSAGEAYAPSTSRYEDLVRTHQVYTSRVHGNGIFLPWHRYFMWTFEQMLRDECGFDRALPWWDETLDAGAFNLSSLFTPEYFGTLPGQTNGAGTCVTDGKFANLTCHIGPGTSTVDHCLSRAVNESYTAHSNTAFINYCNQFDSYGSFESCAETGPHAWSHNGIGSVMSDVYASPSDPIFFMHHAFVDHQFAAWQEANDTRKEPSMIDSACSNSLAQPCTASLSPDAVIDMNGLRPNVTVTDVVNTQSGVFCYIYDSY